MALESHIEFLRKKHARLDELVHQAEVHYDDAALHRLKSEKLNLKDEIMRLTSGQNAAAA